MSSSVFMGCLPVSKLGSPGVQSLSPQHTQTELKEPLNLVTIGRGGRLVQVAYNVVKTRVVFGASNLTQCGV